MVTAASPVVAIHPGSPRPYQENLTVITIRKPVLEPPPGEPRLHHADFTPLRRQDVVGHRGDSIGLTLALELAPLLRQTIDNLAALGPEAALTGPVARGDEATIEAQRAAVEGVAGHLLDLFDELVHHTRALASREVAT